jgi:hypothetical protein
MGTWEIFLNSKVCEERERERERARERERGKDQNIYMSTPDVEVRSFSMR